MSGYMVLRSVLLWHSLLYGLRMLLTVTLEDLFACLLRLVDGC